MADTVASPILQALSDRLYTLTGLPDNKIPRKLRMTVAEIQTIAVEAENRSDETEALKCWITEVKNAAYDADNLFDDYDLWLMKRKVYTRTSFFSLSLAENPLRKLKKIESRFDSLLKRRVELGRAFSEASSSAHYPSKGSEESSNSFIFESEIVGRALDKEIILSMVLDSDSEVEPRIVPFSVIPIIGMGGLGKTTLAQLVYNDERVSRHFDLKVWVYAAENFDVGAIAKAIIEQITNKAQEPANLDALGAIIRKCLSRKRYLIVLDNVWNENQEKWSPLVRWLGVGAHGSKVIVTSRSEKAVAVAATVTVPPYFLKPLTDDESWFLFSRIALPAPKLQEIGRRIVAKCRGLPLAIRTLGGLLRHKREENEWLFVVEEDMWNLPEFESHILPVLRLSYNCLPSHLKQCFAYCSIFPNGCKINKEKLILLWIAEGFVRSARGSKRLEDVGNDHFMELLQRSFFMDVSRDEFGEIAECRMHDLVHDLAVSVASISCSIVETEAPQDVSKELRHSSLVGKSGSSSSSSIVPEALHEATNLRTLLFCSCKFEGIPNLLLNFGSLRALDLSRTGIRKLSSTIGALKHLRYLDLSQTYIQRLPESISNLKNLLTLELSECHDLLELPKAICGLINLRILNIQACSLLSYMPSGIGNLKFLQKLPVFVLGEKDDCAGLGELRGLDLKGRLEIKQLEYVRDVADVVDAKLFEKQSIQSLGLSWGHNVDFDLSAEMYAKVLDGLRPSLNLKVLEIAGYKSSAFPSWIGYRDLPNLVKVSLTNCSCRELPPLGELPYLKDLYIKGMSEVQRIGDEFYGNGNGTCFPSLKQLEIYDMPNLLEWSDFKLGKASASTSTPESSSGSYKEAFPCLETLTVMGCSKLTGLPSFPHLQNLALWNSNEILLCSLAHLTCLSSLLIYEFRPQSLPKDLGFSSIKSLMIHDCGNLINLLDEAMQKFTLLEHLSILYCDRLESLPLGLRCLTSLHKLDIIECRDLANIADAIRHLSSLEELTIEGCPLLQSLPDGMHRGLRKLVIERCPNLQMSESFKMDHIPCAETDIGRFLAEEGTPSESEY